MNIAMWSGPRNLSTAMMYSFGARGDTRVWDEPFYAPYLLRTNIGHALADEIIEACENDPEVIAAQCGAQSDGIFYQKHMCHHMLEGIPLNWAQNAVNVFLIRHPARVIASYHAKHENPEPEEVGLLAQLRLFQEFSISGQAPVVVDASDIRANPREKLSALCRAIGIEFEEAMLSWPKGGHPDDGPWAPHWYGAVHQSTGFAGAEGPLPNLPDHLQSVLDATLPAYEELAKNKI